MILISLAQLLDERTSEEISDGSCQEDEREVGLVIACCLSEVNDDRSYSCNDSSVERENDRIDNEVDIFKFHVVVIINKIDRVLKNKDILVENKKIKNMIPRGASSRIKYSIL